MKRVKTGKRRFAIFPAELGWFPYLWLIYLVLPIINMLSESGTKMAVGYGLIALFTFTYRQLYFAEGEPRFFTWLGIQMSIIFILCMWYHPSYMYMGFFTANFIGWYTDRRNFTIALALFTLVQSAPLIKHAHTLGWRELIFMIPFLLIMVMAPFGIRSLYRRQQLEKELAQANEQIRSLIKGEERMRIARDLHDTLGHTLSLITLKSQLIEKLVDTNAEQAKLEAREIHNTSRSALRQVRELVSEMRTATLAGELQEARVILNSAGIELICHGHPRLAGISDLAQNIMSLCLREAVTNVVKHSQARTCTVTMETGSTDWLLSIEDDGAGLQAGYDAPEKNGLRGMTERLALIGGTLNIESHGGTKLTIRVPIVIKSRKEDSPDGD
ncbi:sensor histidine kinase [Paenibacillus cisolokensis]|uniref:sensor histidine kinase n=1 Tax=Paenibacillus cisolokensis TaxID=1658519 RepID=UPI003D296FFF